MPYEKIIASEKQLIEGEVSREQKEQAKLVVRATLGSQLHHIHAWLDKANPEAVNRILHLMLNEIVVYAETVDLKYK